MDRHGQAEVVLAEYHDQSASPLPLATGAGTHSIANIGCWSPVASRAAVTGSIVSESI